MRCHKGLSRADVLKHGPSKLALMVASEFGRAGDVARHPEMVWKSLDRARELMGLLETVDLPELPAQMLVPLFCRSREDVLLKVLKEPPDRIREICQDYAERFELIAADIAEGAPHA